MRPLPERKDVEYRLVCYQEARPTESAPDGGSLLEEYPTLIAFCCACVLAFLFFCYKVDRGDW